MLVELCKLLRKHGVSLSVIEAAMKELHNRVGMTEEDFQTRMAEISKDESPAPSATPALATTVIGVDVEAVEATKPKKGMSKKSKEEES